MWEFVDCAFTIGQLYGMDLTDAKINLIRPRFRTIPMPANAGYWYDRERGPCPIRVGGAGKDRSKNLKSRIYISGALLDDKPVAGPDLCQCITDGKTPGHGAMGKGSVPASCFVSLPN